MVALLKPRRFTEQPVGPVTIDWSHPLTRKLMGAMVGTQPTELVSGMPFVPYGSAWFAEGRRAQYVSPFQAYPQSGYGSKTSPGCWMADTPTANWKANQPFTFVCAAMMDSVFTGNAQRGRFMGVTNVGVLEYYTGASPTRTQALEVLAIASNGTYPGAYRSTPLVANNLYRAAGVYDMNEGTARVYMGGLEQTTATFGDCNQTLFTSASPTIQIAGTQSNWYLNGSVFHAFAWQRALSDDEIREMAQAPYQFVVPRRNVLFSIATGKQQPHATPRQSRLLTTGTTGTTGPYVRTAAPLAPALRRKDGLAVKNDVVFAQFGERTTRGRLQLFNGAYWEVQPEGIGPSFEDYGNDYSVVSDRGPSISASCPQGTVFVLSYLRSPVGSNGEYPRFVTETNVSSIRGISFILARDSSYGGTVLELTRQGTTTQARRSVVQSSVTGRNSWAATWDGVLTANMKLYRNGVELSPFAGSQVNGVGLYTDAYRIEIGGNAYALRSLDGTIPVTLIFNRVLSGDEILGLHNNYWQIALQQSPRIYVGV